MSNIRVAVRVRPLSEKEKDDCSKEIVQVKGNSVSIQNVKVLGLPEFVDNRTRVREFLFDHCYDSMQGDNLLSTQEKVFEDCGTEVLQAAFDGFNACVFAYGQTGTGKTHTMMGTPEDVGLIPRICQRLFGHMSESANNHVTSRMDISYFEIYNERVRDLLQPELLKQNENYSLKVREHPKEGPYVKDLSWHRVTNNEEIKCLLDRGNEYRVTAETYMHGHSSRSHAIVTVCFTQARLEENQPSEVVSKINMVDLAGSERADPSSRPDFRKRLTEGANINKSLVTLGYVIKALAERSLLSWSTDEMGSTQSFQGSVGGEGQAGSSPAGAAKQRVPYIPYRDSVLTWLLKDSLGGNSKTIMIATITPASQYYRESISTLRYAQRAKNIINKPRINEDQNVALIRELRQEIFRLQGMLANAHMPVHQFGPNVLPGDIVYFVPSLNRGSNSSLDDQGGNLVTLQDSEDSIIAEQLHESEEMAKQLTQSWMCKWSSTHDIMKESDLSIRGLRNRSSSMGVMIDSQLPYLVGMDDDVLSTGIVIFHLKEGDTLVGREDADIPQDIVLHGELVQSEHCVIRHMNGEVYLHPCPGAMCVVQGIDCIEPTRLSQGDYVVLGGNQVFRFNNPSEAAKLREHRRSQGSLHTLNTSHLSFGGLSRASSYSSLGTDDSHYLSPNSQLARSYPNSRRQSDTVIYAAPEMCRDLERRYQTEQERIQEAKRELERLKAEHEQWEELRQVKEEEMYASHEQHRAEIEEQRQQLSRLIEENERARAKAEEELNHARESLAKEKEAFQRQLEEDRRKLKELRKAEQQQESLGIQTDPLSTQSTSVGSDTFTVTSTSTGSDDPSADQPKQKRGRIMSAKDQLEELEQKEFTRRMSYRETEESLAIQAEDIEEAYMQTQEQIEEKIRKIKMIEDQYKEMDKQHLKEIAAQTERVKEIHKQEVQLEVYIQENEELMSVRSDQPRPLRSACSELFLVDPNLQAQEFSSQKTNSLHNIQGTDIEDNETLSPRSRPLRRSSSADSLDSTTSSEMKGLNVKKDQKRDPDERKLSSTTDPKILSVAKKVTSTVAKQVTSRLYQAPEPKFKYVPKVKEKEIKTIPRTKVYRDRNPPELKPKKGSTKPSRDFERSKSESPQRVANKRSGMSPSKDAQPKKRSSSAPLKEPKTGAKSKPDQPNKENHKDDKPELNIMAIRKKPQGPSRTLSPTSRLGGAISPERLGIMGTSPARSPSLRHITSASSLASVPESQAENEDATHETNTQQDIANYPVKKRQKKGRANFLDDNFRCHSAPDSQYMAEALDEYTDQMSANNRDGQSVAERPPLLTSFSIDESDLCSADTNINFADENKDQNLENEKDFIISDSDATARAISDSNLDTKTDNVRNVDEIHVAELAESVQDFDMETQEIQVTDLLESAVEQYEVENTETVTLGKRERNSTDTETDVPVKKSKPVKKKDTMNNNNDSGELKLISEHIDIFSEDSLESDISMDSLENESGNKKLSQSLPVYLVRDEKAGFSDSFSDISFEVDNEDQVMNVEKLSADEFQSSEGKDLRDPESLKQETEVADIKGNDHEQKGIKLTISKVHLEPVDFIPAVEATILDLNHNFTGDTQETESEQPQDIEKVKIYVNDIIHHAQDKCSELAESGEDTKKQCEIPSVINVLCEEVLSEAFIPEDQNVIPTVVEDENEHINDEEPYAIVEGEMNTFKVEELSDTETITDLSGTEGNLVLNYVATNIGHDMIQNETIAISQNHVENNLNSESEDKHKREELSNAVNVVAKCIGKEMIDAASRNSQDFRSQENEDGNTFKTNDKFEKGKTQTELEVDENDNIVTMTSNECDTNADVFYGKTVTLNADNIADIHTVKETMFEKSEDENTVEEKIKENETYLNVETVEEGGLNSSKKLDLEILTQTEETVSEEQTLDTEKHNNISSYNTEDNNVCEVPTVDILSNNESSGGDTEHLNVSEVPVVDTGSSNEISSGDTENMEVLESPIGDLGNGIEIGAGDTEYTNISEAQALNTGNKIVINASYIKQSNVFEAPAVDMENKNERGAFDNKEDLTVTLKVRETDLLTDKSSVNKKSGDNEQDAADLGESGNLPQPLDMSSNLSTLPRTRSVAVNTSLENLDSLDDMIMGDDSCDSLELDPRAKIQVLQEVLDQLPIKPPAGPQISDARRATRQRAMIRQQHRGNDSDGAAQFSDDSLLSGTQTKVSSRPGSGSRRRKRLASRNKDKTAKHSNNKSSEEYDCSDNDSLYSDDSVDATWQLKPQSAVVANGCAFPNGINGDLVFEEGREAGDMLSRPKHKHHGAQGAPPPRNEVTEILEGPDGRRTVGIQTPDHSGRLRSHGSARGGDLSDLDGSFTSGDFNHGMVLSPLSLWNSNERSGSDSHSDRNSTSSAGLVVNLNELERGMTPTPRSGARSSTSAFSEKSNLDRGPTEVWSSSSSELRPLISFQDELSYIIETEGMSPGASSLDYTEDAQSQRSSVYMRTPRGERLIPQPHSSTPNNSGRVVSISFPERQLEQATNLDNGAPVKFQVTVHESNTNVEYNVAKTEYKTYTLRNQNELNIIPDRILVNMTENVNTVTEENQKIEIKEEITLRQPDNARSPEDSLVLERSFRSSNSSEREMEIENGNVTKDESKEFKEVIEVKANYVVPSEVLREPCNRMKKLNLKQSEVESTSYPGATEEDSGEPDLEATGSSNNFEAAPDHGTITSVEGKKGNLSFTSDSEDEIGTSPRTQQVTYLTPNIPTNKSNEGLSKPHLLLEHDDIFEPEHATEGIFHQEESLCPISEVINSVSVAASLELSTVAPESFTNVNTPKMDVQRPTESEKKLRANEPVNDLGYESMRPVSDEESVEHIYDDTDTDNSTVSTVKCFNEEKQSFTSQDTLRDLTPDIMKEENVTESVDMQECAPSRVPRLDLNLSVEGSPRKQRKTSCSSTDDTYVSLDQSDGNTSTVSSDYRTPQQSPRGLEGHEMIAPEHVDEVEIPDYDEREQSESTPRQEFVIGPDQAPVLTSSPKQSQDMRTVSVNTESVPSILQSAPPAISKIKFFGETKDSETLRKHLEKKIARLQRRMRSMSDSAISSDFTDGDSSSLSPRGSKVYDEKSFLEEKIHLQADNPYGPVKSYHASQSPPHLRQTLKFESSPSRKFPFKDSGNVFDEESPGSGIESDIEPGEIVNQTVPTQHCNTHQEYGILAEIKMNEKPSDLLPTIKPYQLKRCASLDSLSTILSLQKQLAKAVKDSQPNPEMEEADVPRSPGEVDIDPENINKLYDETDTENMSSGRSNTNYNKINGKSTSMSTLEGAPSREYLRSFSEGNLDDYEENNESNSSNDSITFVFIADNRKRPVVDQVPTAEITEGAESYDPCGSGEQMYDSDNDSSDSQNRYSPGEYAESDLQELVNISGRGHPSPKSEDRVSDVLSRSASESSVVEMRLRRCEYEEDEVSTHTASEEIEQIINSNDNIDDVHGSRELGVGLQSASPPTYTDTSDGPIQANTRHYYDEDSEPLRHRFGIDESVLPIPERSVSADNIPKQLMPMKIINKSRSTGMLDVGVSNGSESESGIFPPAVYHGQSEEDRTEPSISLYTMSEGRLEYIAQRTYSDVEASISNPTSADIVSQPLNSEENSSAVVRSICSSRSTSVEEFEEEFIIDYKSNKPPKPRRSVEDSVSSDGELDAELMDDEQHIRQVLQTVQRLIMPKPTTMDRGVSTDNEAASNFVSIGVQATTEDTSTQTLENLESLIQPDQIILPALAAPFRSQSMDSFGLLANGQGLDLSEGSRNWCTLGELMVETTHLLRRINDRLPELDSRAQPISSQDNYASQVLLKKWQEISVQTGQSMENLTTVSSQTDAECLEDNAYNQKKESVSESVQVEPELRMEPLHLSETITHELLPVATSPREISIQTDETLTSWVEPESENDTIKSDEDDLEEPMHIDALTCVARAIETTDKLQKTAEDSINLKQEMTSEAVTLGKKDYKEPVIAQSVAPVAFLPRKLQTNGAETSEEVSLLKDQTRSPGLVETPVRTSLGKSEAKYIPQLKADLGLNGKEMKLGDSTDNPESPRKGTNRDSAVSKPKTHILPGLTLPNTSEIDKLRKEHEKLMVNLRKASEDRNNRKKKLQAWKKPIETGAQSLKVSPTKSKPEFHINTPQMDACKSKTQVTVRQPCKNDPETDTSRGDNSVEIEIVRSDGEDEETKPETRQCTTPTSEHEFVQINIGVDPSRGVKVENKILKESSPKTKLNEKNSEDDKKPVNTKEQHTWQISGDEFRSVFERRPDSLSRTESTSSQDTTEPNSFGGNKPLESEPIDAVRAGGDSRSEGLDVVDNDKIISPRDNVENYDKIYSSEDEIEQISSQRSPLVKTDLDLEELISTNSDRESPASVVEVVVIPLSEKTKELPAVKFEDLPQDWSYQKTLGKSKKVLSETPVLSQADKTSSQKSLPVEATTVPQSHRREQHIPIVTPVISQEDKTKSLETLPLEETIVPDSHKREKHIPSLSFKEPYEMQPLSEPESVSEDDPRERGPKMPKKIVKSETSPKYKAQLLREQQRQPVSPELLERDEELHKHDSPSDTEQSEDEAVDDVLSPRAPSVKDDDRLPTFHLTEQPVRPPNKTFRTNENRPDHKHEIPGKLHSTPDETDSKQSVLKTLSRSPGMSTQTTEPQETIRKDPTEKGTNRPYFSDDATQMSVEFSDDCTQTEPDKSAEETVIPKSKDNFHSTPKLHDSKTKSPSNPEEPSSLKDEAPMEGKSSQDLREELENLQTERQHIMDLLGLSYLPNSLTVELLEAKLNYCIGQTDLLLNNLEDITNTEPAKKVSVEQTQTKDYISKYRADLKQSKKDIEECREQLNKRKGREPGLGRGRTPYRRRDILAEQRQAELDAFRLERLREQQDYERSRHGHGLPLKHGTPNRGNTPLKGNTPLHGNSPSVTPRSDRSRSSSPSYSPSYMNPREHKTHLVELRKQLIRDVVEEEMQHSRSCSPSFHPSPHTKPNQRSQSEHSLGFSPKDSPDGSPSYSSPSSQGSRSYLAPGASSFSPGRRVESAEPAYRRSAGNQYGSYNNSPDRKEAGRKPSAGNLDSMSVPMEEMLRRSSFSSTSSQRSNGSRSELPIISPRSSPGSRLPSHPMENLPALNLDCLQDDQSGPYSPYSAYAREHLIPNERSPPGGRLQGTYELYEHSDSSSVMSYDSESSSSHQHRPRHNTLDEDTIKRLRPIRAEDIKARINRHKR